MRERRIRQTVAGSRAKAYRPVHEQVGALVKLVRVLIDAAPPEVLARIDPDALAELEHVEAVKRRIPKKDKADG